MSNREKRTLHVLMLIILGIAILTLNPMSAMLIGFGFTWTLILWRE